MDRQEIATNTPESAPIQKPKRLNKRQKDFIQNWCSVDSETFGNSYQSAIKAGFAPNTAKMITSNVKNLEWLEEAKRYMADYSPFHVIAGFQNLASTAKQDRDKIQALDRLAKIKGMYVERSQTEVNVSFTNNVPRPILDVTEYNNPHTDQ